MKEHDWHTVQFRGETYKMRTFCRIVAQFMTSSLGLSLAKAPGRPRREILGLELVICVRNTSGWDRPVKVLQDYVDVNM